MSSKPEIIYQENKVKKLNIIHFNDVYNVECAQSEPVGGASRFLTAVERLMEIGPTLVFFSGDAISPSTISQLVKGRQMIDILNKCHINCACLGNHDFDYGLDILLTHIENSNFPWLLSNVFDAETKKPLGNVNDKHIIEFQGLKIGIIGLVEEDWIDTLAAFDSDDILYESFIDVGRKLTKELKQEHGCDLVFALTHMRLENDKILVENVPEIDLFLGGHDHDYIVEKIKDRWLVKSGTDFRELSFVEATFENKQINVTKIEKHIVDSTIEENQEINSIIDNYLKSLSQHLDKVLGVINIDLDGRFSSTRTEETNLGNFVTDIMLQSIRADCCLLNSGFLRSDMIHHKGEFKVKDLKKILPFESQALLIEVTGSQLLQALENSVSKYPQLEGRFLQVSGLKYAFDPSKDEGNRVDARLVQIQDEYLDLNKSYKVATNMFLHSGKDGYECLKNCPLLVDSENMPGIYNLVENHFDNINLIKNDSKHKLRPRMVPIPVIDRLLLQINESTDFELENDDDDYEQSSNILPTFGKKMNFFEAVLIGTKVITKNMKLSKKRRRQLKLTEIFQKKLTEYEQESMSLTPKVEGRIILIKDQEHFEQLLAEREKRIVK